MRDDVGFEAELAGEISHVDCVRIEAAPSRHCARIVDAEVAALRPTRQLDQDYNEVEESGDRDQDEFGGTYRFSSTDRARVTIGYRVIAHGYNLPSARRESSSLVHQ